MQSWPGISHMVLRDRQGQQCWVAPPSQGQPAPEATLPRVSGEGAPMARRPLPLCC